MHKSFAAGLLFALGCGSASMPTADVDAGPKADAGPSVGTASVTGTVTGLALESPDAQSIVRMYPPHLQLKIAIASLDCTSTQKSDHLTFDLGSAQPGTYTIVKGYPSETSLSGFQARGHACPATVDPDATPACHNSVLSGSITLTAVGDAARGRVDGSFELVLADGKVTGTFSALRCD